MSGPVRPLLAATALAVLCGCAQTGRLSSPLAMLKKPAAAKKAEAEAEPFKPAKEAEKKEGEKPEVAKTEPPATKPDEKPPAKPEAKPATAVADASVPASKEKPAGLVHDAETLALIEEELTRVSPQERAKLYEEFKTLDGEMIRQLIRINRMVRDLDATRTAAAGAPAASAALASAGPAAAALAAASAEPRSRVLNLGGTGTTTTPLSTASGELLAEAPPEIRPAGHSVSTAGAPIRTAAAVGHSTTRPVPVLHAITGTPGVAANGPPLAPPAESADSLAARDGWSLQLRQLIAAAEMRADAVRSGYLDIQPNAPMGSDAARQTYVESQVHLRLLYLMAGEQARAMQAIPGLESADQEFWQQVLWGVSNYFDEGALPNRADRATQTVEQLRSAVARLQSEANLSLRNVAFCRKITSFGSYEKFERDEYEPGQPVLLYAEVANFKSVAQPSDGLYRTQLKSTIEMYRAGEGQPINKIDFEPTTDLCRSHRQDYFHSYELKVPSTLTLGPHVLKLTVEDVQTGKLATYSLNFTVK